MPTARRRAASWRAPVEKLDLARGDVGVLVPGVELELVDEATGAASATGTGRIRIRGEGVVERYYGNADANDSHFRDGWFYPGDVGTLSPDGMLRIAGREDSVISFGGVKATLETIEAAYREAPGLKQLAVVPGRDRSGILRPIVFVVPGDGWSEDAFRRYCRSRVEPTFWPAKLVMVAVIPRGPAGKIDRQRLAALVS
jgi:acyl-CoA synthetase (AMP-forming)/AMP-acid ligase II